jgi:hypothetical protein
MDPGRAAAFGRRGRAAALKVVKDRSSTRSPTQSDRAFPVDAMTSSGCWPPPAP